MKKQVFTMALALASCLLTAQAPGWAWATANPSNTNDDSGKAIATDASGNVYYTGSVKGVLPGSVITSNNIFVVKTDPSGTVLWTVKVGGDADDAGTAIAVDKTGNVFVAGNYVSASVAFATATLTSSGQNDVFLARFSSSGTELWAKKIGGTKDEFALGLAVDSVSNVFISGNYASPTLTIGTTGLTNNSVGSESDIFLARYDASGSPVWAETFGGTHRDQVSALSTDVQGNILMAGTLYGTALIFGTTTLTPTFAAITTGDPFVAKFNPSGTALWAKSATGSYFDEGKAICADKQGNVYTTGGFKSATVSFGTFSLTNTSTYSVDIFVTKYSASGTELWSKAFGSADSEETFGIKADDNSNIYVAGSFQSAALAFGSTTLTNAAAGKNDIFAAKLDASGNALWSVSAGAAYDENLNGLSVDNTGNVYITGDFKSASLAFGSTTLTNQQFFIGNIGDAYAAKLGNGAAPPPPVGTGIKEAVSLSGQSLVMYPNPSRGNVTLRVSSEITLVNIISSYGLLLKTYPVVSGESINLELQENGVYFIQAIGAEGSVIKKLSVTR